MLTELTADSVTLAAAKLGAGWWYGFPWSRNGILHEVGTQPDTEPPDVNALWYRNRQRKLCNS